MTACPTSRSTASSSALKTYGIFCAPPRLASKVGVRCAQSDFRLVSQVTDESISFVDETRRVSAQSLLDSILMTPDIFDRLHDLNSNERKIPGLLTVNSQASKLFQIKVNEVYLQQIDELVRFQNIYINLIKWDELETFL